MGRALRAMFAYLLDNGLLPGRAGIHSDATVGRWQVDAEVAASEMVRLVDAVRPDESLYEARLVHLAARLVSGLCRSADGELLVDVRTAGVAVRCARDVVAVKRIAALIQIRREWTVLRTEERRRSAHCGVQRALVG